MSEYKKINRLLIVSSRSRNKVAISGSILSNVIKLEYDYETSTLSDLAANVKKVLSRNLPVDSGLKVASMAFVMHSSEKELFLVFPGEAKVSIKTVVRDPTIREFFSRLAADHLDLAHWGARIDFLATYAAEHIDGALIAKEFETMLGCKVSMARNLTGSDVIVPTEDGGKSEKGIRVGELYFDVPKLKKLLNNVGVVGKDGYKKLDGYEKIRVVGKGAFGQAVLYTRKSDGLMSIIKEVNMLDLSANDRQMALNEVKVLSKMDHPNIIAYYDSFEKDGVLMIEMEYADGGNLADFLAKQQRQLEERDLMDIIYQMVSAVRHMHEHDVLHRDLKTANIFLTKDGLIKIGDFGISKMLTTRGAGAHSVLGTPYYISPEMCEGKVYDEKSDIWALGCIIYEMACLQKTFEGSNLPALVNKIMKGQFDPIRGNYSPLFKKLVRDLLQHNPEFRPAASEIYLVRLPEITASIAHSYMNYDDISSDEFIDDVELIENRTKKVRTSRPPRSVLYYMKAYESWLSLTPIQLPPRTRITQVVVSTTHVVVLTYEYLVYTWGDGRRGQLGHGVRETWRSTPTCVETLKTKSISRIGAGHGFSVFASDNGIVMTCGDGSLGCLGHGDWNSSAQPELVEALLSVHVTAVACGPEHVVVVGSQGDVYAWGRGSEGRLGLGHEEDTYLPQDVKINTEDVYIVNVKCSGAATILLSNEGILYACGENNENRLGLDGTGLATWVTSSQVKTALVPTRIHSIRARIVDVAMSTKHTVCLTEAGKVITMGRNEEAQLGRGHARGSRYGPEMVKSMAKKDVSLIAAGSTFTMVGTNENVISVWGTRHVSIQMKGDRRASDPLNRSYGSRLATRGNRNVTDAEIQEMLKQEMMRNSNDVTSDRDQMILEGSGGLLLNKEEIEKNAANIGSNRMMNTHGEIRMRDVVTEPQEVLAMYASERQQEKGETVMLKEIICQGHNIFIVVDTTCPLRKGDHRPSTAEVSGNPDRRNGGEIVIDMKDHKDDDEKRDEKRKSKYKRKPAPTPKSVTPDLDKSALPDWLRDELNNSEEAWIDDLGPGGGHNNNNGNNSKSVSTADLRKKQEREYNQKSKELYLEAQNSVRLREEAYNQEMLKQQSSSTEVENLQDYNDGGGAAKSNCILQ